MKACSALNFLRYRQLGSNLKVCVVVDSSRHSVSHLRPQAAYMVFLRCRSSAHDVGGVCHVLEFVTKKSTCIARISFEAETLSANRRAEAGVRILGWLCELEDGTEDSSELMDSENTVRLLSVTGARDLCAAIQRARPYRGADHSISPYLETLKEDQQH